MSTALTVTQRAIAAIGITAERAKRRAYQQSARGREVHREACRVYVRLRQMEARA